MGGDIGNHRTMQSAARAVDRRAGVISTRATDVVTWPGPDRRPVSRENRTVKSGLLAGRTFRKVRDTILANIRARQARSVERDD